MNLTTTVSIITCCVFFLSQSGCQGCDDATPAAEAKPIDWSKYDIDSATDGDANLILWVKVNIDKIRNEEYVYPFSATTRNGSDAAAPEHYHGATSFSNWDGVSKTTGHGTGGTLSACVDKMEKEGVVFSFSCSWHMDEDNGNLHESILLPFNRAQKIEKGRLTITSSFEWKRDIQDKAANGDASAQYRLGELLWHGQGFKGGNKQAAHWYRKASEQGFVQAQLMYAHMCGGGYGVPQDLVEAYKWYAICNDSLGTKGEDLTKRVSPNMTRKEIVEGERRAAEYRRQHRTE